MPTQNNNPWAEGGQYHEDWGSKNNPAFESPFAKNAKEYSGEFENIGDEYKNEFANAGNEYQNIGAEYANEFSPTDTDVLDSRELFENDAYVLGLKKEEKQNKELNIVIANSIDRRNLEDTLSGLSQNPSKIHAPAYLVDATNKVLEFQLQYLIGLFTINANKKMKTIVNDMFDTFTKRLAGINNYDYKNLYLNSEIANHLKMKEFIKYLSNKFNDRMIVHKGNINNFIKDHGKIFLDEPPVFDDLFGGFRISIDALNYTEVVLNSYQIVGKKYIANININLYDAFGLDTKDVLNILKDKRASAIPQIRFSFQAWWLLQHTRGYSPLDVLITINKTIYGTI